MKVEDHRSIRGEQAVEVAIAEAMGVLAGLGEGKQFDHVEHPNFEAGDRQAQDLHSCQGLFGGDVASAGHDDGWVFRVAVAVIVAGPAPQANPLGHMGARLLEREVLEMGLFVANDDVADVGFHQGLLGNGQQAVGVGGQIDPHHVAALVAGQVNEARILVGETVVVLSPNRAGDQAGPGGDRRPPGGMVYAALQPFGVLVEHRGNDMGEGLIGVEKPMPPRQQVALHHPHQGVLAQHFHHPATAAQFAAVGVFGKQLFEPNLFAALVDGLEPVGGGFVRAENPH